MYAHAYISTDIEIHCEKAQNTSATELMNFVVLT